MKSRHPMLQGMFAVALVSLTLPLAGCMAPKAGTINVADLPPFVPGDAARGQEVFKQGCAECHGQDARGKWGNGNNLVVPSKWMQKQTDAMLLQFLKGFHNPPLAKSMEVTDEALRDVITYIRSIQQPK